MIFPDKIAANSLTFNLLQEFRLVIPNSQRLNRGNYEFNQLIQACKSNDVTDFIVLHEHRGTPDGKSKIKLNENAIFSLG